MHMPDELDSRIRELVWRLVETSPAPPPFPSPVDARDETARTVARPARLLLGRLRPRTSRGLMGVIVIAVAIVALFVVPIPQLHLFGHRSGHHPLPTVPAVGTRLAELKGSDTTPGDYFGSSLAISGGTLVVGAFDQANNAGRAYVFKTTAVGWKQVAELKGSDAVAGDNFGSSVAISGRTIVVGSSSYAQSPGSAYVFAQTASGWRQVAELKSPPIGAGPGSHTSVAISGGTIVVGWTYISLYSATESSVSLPGAAYVYTKTATGWRQTAALRGLDSAGSDGFGCSVAISGKTVIVGATASPPGHPEGRAYVFTRTAGGWQQAAELPPSGTVSPSFGLSVAVSGSTAVVGGDGSSPLYVFSKTPTGWKPAAVLKNSDAAAGNGFGSTVAISGTTVIVGSPDFASFTGRAYLFTERRHRWKQIAELNGSKSAGDYFGAGVAVSGSTAVVSSIPTSGSPDVHENGSEALGRAYVFQA